MKVGDKVTVPLFTIAHQQIGGTESSIYNLVASLQAAGADTHVAYSRLERLSPEFRSWLGLGLVTSHRQRPLPGPKNVRFFEEAFFEYGRKTSDWVLYPNYFVGLNPLRERRPTAVLLHDIQYKVLPEFHSPRRRAWLDFYLPKMFESADVVLLISKAEQAAVAQHFGNAAADKCQVIYNAIDWSRFETGEVRREVLDLAAEDYLIAVCQPLPAKNIKTLLQAFNGVSQAFPDLKLYLVGAQSQVNMALVAEHATAQAAERIKFPGFVSDRELGLLYQRAKVFVHPSLYEGFGMPAVEALGFGVPILVSDLAALKEVTLGAGHYVQEIQNPAAWEARLKALLASGQEGDRVGAQAARGRYALGAVGGEIMRALS